MTNHFKALAVAMTVLVAIGSLSDTAEAVIGRPLTPVSYAGVARRTTRRAAVAGAYATPVYAPPVVQSTTVVTSLPAGCGKVVTSGAVVYSCGGANYSPSYNGSTVVYQRM
jgi:hypothetical protein